VIALLSVFLLVLVHAAPSLVQGEPADLAARTQAMARALTVDSVSTSRTSPGRPHCALDVCAPVVNVPGFEPRWDIRGRRTELFLSMLDRMDLGAISSTARWIAATGVTVDYRLPDREQALQVNVYMRWRIDAFGAPVALAR
jgi:hypothetical protein